MEKFIRLSHLYASRPFLFITNIVLMLFLSTMPIKTWVSFIMYEEYNAIPTSVSFKIFFFISALIYMLFSAANIGQVKKERKLSLIQLLPQVRQVKIAYFCLYQVILPIVSIISVWTVFYDYVFTIGLKYIVSMLFFSTWISLRHLLRRDNTSTSQHIGYWLINFVILTIVAISTSYNVALIVTLTLLIVLIVYYYQATFTHTKIKQRARKKEKDPAWLLFLINKKHTQLNYLIYYDRQFFLNPLKELLVTAFQLVLLVLFVTLSFYDEIFGGEINVISARFFTWWTSVIAIFVGIINVSKLTSIEVNVLPLEKKERWLLTTIYTHIKLFVISGISVLLVLTTAYFGSILLNEISAYSNQGMTISYLMYVQTGLNIFVPTFFYTLGVYHAAMSLHHLFLLLMRDDKRHLSLRFVRQSQLYLSLIVAAPILLVEGMINMRFINNLIDLRYIIPVILCSLFIDYFAKNKLEVI